MGLRLQNIHYDLDGNKHTINLYDSAYSHGVVPFDVAQPGIIKTYNASSQERNAAIISSSLKFQMLIEGATLGSFVTDFIAAPEQRFRVVHLIDDVIEWAGLVLTDLVVLEDNYDPYLFEIEAVDGLAKLKDLEYSDNGNPYTGKVSLKEHLVNILSRLGTLDLLPTDAIKSVINWYSDQHSGTGVDVMENTRVNHKAFINVDSSGTLTYRSCLDVLTAILTPFFCRIKMVNGAFFVFQVPEYAASSYTVHKSTAAGTGTGSDSAQSFVKIDETDIDRLFGNQFQFYPALNEVENTYKHYSTQSIVDPDVITFTEFTSDEVDTINGSSTMYFYIKYKYHVGWASANPFIPVRTKVRLTIAVGSYYLERKAEINAYGAVSYSAVKWTTTRGVNSGYFEFFTDAGFEVDKEYTKELASVITPPIPENGTLLLNSELSDTYDLTGQVVSDPGLSISLSIFDSYIEIIEAGNIENRINKTIFGVTNDAAGNSKRLPIETIIGDGPTGNTFGHLEAWDGTEWQITSSWASGALGTNTKISLLLSQQIMATQGKPMRIISGELIGDYSPIYALQYNNQKYVFHSGSYESANNKWNGRWFLIDSAGVTTTPKDEQGLFELEDEPLPPRTPVIISEPDVYSDEEEQPARVAVQIQQIPLTTTDSISAGDTISSIQIAAPGQDDVIKANDTITLINQVTGENETFVVSTDVGAADTTLSVNSKTAENDYTAGSFVTVSQQEILKKINIGSGGGKTRYKEEFPGQTSTTVTVTKNGGVLPASDDDIDVLYNGREIKAADWSKSGSNIILGFDPAGADVTIKFLI